MGGAQAGEIASNLAATAVQHAERGESRGRGARRRADPGCEPQRLRARPDATSPRSGMGTTMTVALVDDDLVRFGHVGDSRAYLVRDHALEQVTDDHSLVGELVRSGRLSPEEAEAHPHRSVITRALGTDPDVDVDTFSVAARPGDLFMLCSDGLIDMVDDATILELIEEHRGDVALGGAGAVARRTRAAARTTSPSSSSRSLRSTTDERPARSSPPRPRTATTTRTRSTGSTRSRSCASPRRHGGSGAGRSASRREAARLLLARRVARSRSSFIALVAAPASSGSRAPTSSASSATATSPSTRACPGTCRFGIHLYREVYTSPLLAAAAVARPSGRSSSTTRCAAADAGAAPVKQYEPLRGGSPMSYRNRELVSLVVVGVMTGFGFASVYIARQEVVSAASLSYGVFFLCLYLAAHVVPASRCRTPTRTCCPLGGAPDGDRRHRDLPDRPDDALRQASGSSSASARLPRRCSCCGTTTAGSRATSTSSAIGAVVLLVLPRCPVIGQRVNGARLWIHVGGSSSSPASSRSSC